MTFADIVAAQVGAGLAMRTSRQSVFSLGLFANRLRVAGIVLEIAVVAVLSYAPRLRDAFHMEGLGPWHWLSLTIWPPLVLGVEEARKALLRRRDARATDAVRAGR